MKKVIASLVAVAGMSVAAHAVVNTSIVWQVSTDNVNWSSSVNALPSSTVYSRALVSYTGTAAPLGLASLAFQPTLSNWTAADTLLPFVAGGQGSNTLPAGNVGVVTDASSNTQFGRVSPFGRSALSATNFMRGHVHANPDGSGATYLRIAQNQVTSWIGGAGNTTGGSGVLIGQLNDVGRTTAEPAFVNSLQNILVFKMGITLSAVDARPDLILTAPADGFGNRNSTNGDREIYWFSNMTESTGQIRGTATVTGATIHVVPAPASLALLGLGGLAVARRRRA